MNEKKLALMFLSILVLSTLVVAYIPNVASSPDVSFDAKISPSTVSGKYPPVSTKFIINVTGLSDTDPIDKVEITYPTSWEYVGVQAPTGWTSTHTPPKVTFTTTTHLIEEGAWKLFNVTVKVASGFGEENTWRVKCYSTSADTEASKDLSVYVTPWFSAVITPNLKKAGETLWFELKVTNNASESSIRVVEITYPDSDGWTLIDYTGPTGWTYTYLPPTITFTAPSGYEIAKNAYVIFKFRMITGTPVSPTTNTYNWPVVCTNTLGKEARMIPTVTIDNTKPEVTVEVPVVDWYSVGSGNYMWLNLTVKDDIKMEPTVKLNDTRFSHYYSGYVGVVGGKHAYKFCYRNNTAISDGPLAIQVNVTDYVGNTATVYPKVVETTVDNTPPFIWIKVTPATPVGSTFWIGKTTASVTVNVTVADYALEPIGPLTGIYINGTRQTAWNFGSTSKEYKGYPVWECVKSLTTPTDKRLWIVFVNVTDMARPKNHTSQMTVYIQRDLVPPYEIGFTTVKPICGGLIIYGLYAKDTVGIGDFRIYLNGTNIANVTYTDLIATTWKPGAGYGSFSGVAVLDLTSYVGKYVNITASARDYGLNEGSKIVVFTGKVPSGLWAPIVLRAGWNLISLPLIPNSTATADIYSLILKQKAAGVLATYGFNNEVKTWILDPTTMTDGNAYWINVKAYDVLIVHGRPTPRPPALPTTYHLYKGWNFAGFTETKTMKAGDYLASLEPGSYFRYIYVWDAVNQEWKMVDTKTPSTLPTNLEVGQGFLIYMYKEQDLIPPIDP